MGISAIDAAATLLNVSEIQQERSAELHSYSVFKDRLSTEHEKESESTFFDRFLPSGNSHEILKMTNFSPNEIYHVFDKCKESLRKTGN